MQPGEPTGEQIESVTFRLANLEISIAARVVEEEVSSTASGFELVTDTPTPGVAFSSGTPSYPQDRGLENRVLAASTPRELEELSLLFLGFLTGRLRATGSEWTPRARIARAFQCGIAAGRRLSSETCSFAAQAIPFRNTVYVVLRVPDLEPFWTSSYGTYISAVGSQSPPSGSEFHPESVSHAFPTKAEAEAYCVGARRPWPRQL
eukprot:Skav231693  [mRNA]  locus=scaffold597:1127874:1128491:+ [translate_table: standard]